MNEFEMEQSRPGCLESGPTGGDAPVTEGWRAFR
jgi:hypothetical protein